MTKPTLICMAGLPRSGKTTFARAQGHPIVNPDSVRLAIHGQRYLDLLEPLVWIAAKWMVKSLFLAGHSQVVVDATNMTRKRRDAWQSPDWRTVFKLIDTPFEECVRRAQAVGDAAIIPVIERMNAEYEVLEPYEIRYESLTATSA